ncbi:hypothetical protein M427DRAFT_366635 [Gonapodya prolifera JEL478]|uniref:Ribosomal protein S6 n=1 Tax=Gonapodya prolifera (strain JEL478) TaxID=1344416 RepID=A0A139AAC8_GONPJ|nr:hypothetical protein M427DRAFT_366635 [Gonapodya prolifera JEL478]|eukprot:KXS13687.1 hypothetical protein M427DRAFT_366635 [Gonapodya prolifera JEL478]
MLYELVCIARNHGQDGVRDLVRQSALFVLDNNGVVRGFQNMGANLPLYQRIKAHQEWHTHGWYWAMQFDSSPSTMQSLLTNLKLDERVVRATTISIKS